MTRFAGGEWNGIPTGNGVEAVPCARTYCLLDDTAPGPLATAGITFL